jgi:hypothetical protein
MPFCRTVPSALPPGFSAHRPEPNEPPMPEQPPQPDQPDQPDTIPDPTREPPQPESPPIGDPPPEPNETPHVYVGRRGCRRGFPAGQRF